MAHFPKIQLCLFMLFSTIFAFLLNLVLFSVFTYRLITTPNIKHQQMQAVVGKRKQRMDEAIIIEMAKQLPTYYFIASVALLTSNAPPAALNPSTVSLMYTFMLSQCLTYWSMNSPNSIKRIPEGRQKAAKARNPQQGDLVERVATRIRICVAMGPGRDCATFTISLYCVSENHYSQSTNLSWKLSIWSCMVPKEWKPNQKNLEMTSLGQMDFQTKDSREETPDIYYDYNVGEGEEKGGKQSVMGWKGWEGGELSRKGSDHRMMQKYLLSTNTFHIPQQYTQTDSILFLQRITHHLPTPTT